MDLSESILLQVNWALPLSPLLILCETKNPPQGPLVKSVFISGTIDLQGCVHRFHSWGVGMPGPCPEDLVQGRDGGDSQEPAVCGWGSLPPEVWICPGVPLHVPSVPFEIPCFSWLSSKPCWLTHVKLPGWHQEFKLDFLLGDLPAVWCRRSFSTAQVFIKLISNVEITSCLFCSPVFLVQ